MFSILLPVHGHTLEHTHTQLSPCVMVRQLFTKRHYALCLFLAILHVLDTFRKFPCALGAEERKEMEGILERPTCVFPSSQQGRK